MPCTETPDFHAYDHGSLVGLDPLTQAASDWLSNNVEAESYQFLGRVLWIDHRLATAVVQGFQNDGLILD